MEAVTGREFIFELLKQISLSKEEAISLGVIETGDVLCFDEYIAKRSVARIIHEVLLKVFKEADEDDWSASLDLKDLYECHTCVRHIAQVYAKGIMDAKDNLFMSKAFIDKSEQKAILKRLSDRESRRVPKRKPVDFGYVDKEYAVRSKNELGAIIIDVRARESFLEGAIIAGSINLSLRELYLNPYSASADLNGEIILVCERGYQSSVAAKLLLDAGYRNVNIVK